MKQSKIVSVSFSSVGTTYLCTRDEAKEHCIINTSDTSWDSYIDTLLLQCTNYLQSITGRSMVAQTVTAYIDYESDFSFPYGPLGAITSIKQRTGIAAYTAITANTDYEVTGDRVEIFSGCGRYQLIYTVTADGALKQALLNEIAYRFENRGDVQNNLREFTSVSRETLSLIEPLIDKEWLS